MFRHSLIVPAYNEEMLLPRLLDSVERARERYAAGRDAVEVIVADNLSTDRTAAVARDRGCRVVRVERRTIAAARNGGARAARGAVLAFVDADTRIHPDTFDAIDDVLADPGIVGGTSGIRFERTSLGIRCTAALLRGIGAVIGLWYGQRPPRQVETGVVFCRRRDFEMIGGYNENRRFAEDVEFLIDLMRLGRRRGQRMARGTRAPAVFSTRKFDEYGDWHYFTTMPVRLAIAAITRRSATDDFAQRYWYERRA